MKKSTYIDYAVLMAVRSHKRKKKNEQVKGLLSRSIMESEDSQNQRITKALTTAIVVEVFTHGLTA